MITDMLSGQIDGVIDLLGSYLPQIKAGKLPRWSHHRQQAAAKRCRTCRPLKELGIDFAAEPWYGLEGSEGHPARRSSRR